MTDHTKTHPNMFVPQEFKALLDLQDVSYHNDECPNFYSEQRKEFIFCHQDAKDSEPVFSIWGADDDGGMTENELFVAHGLDELKGYLKKHDDLFAAFQSTRQYKKDSEMEGYAYLDTYKNSLAECLHVEITNGKWKTEGKYGICIYPSRGITSDNLKELERHVFKFAMAEGYADQIVAIANKGGE